MVTTDGVSVVADEQTVAALQASQLTTANPLQLQQMFVITDPSQLEALQVGHYFSTSSTPNYSNSLKKKIKKLNAMYSSQPQPCLICQIWLLLTSQITESIFMTIERNKHGEV